MIEPRTLGTRFAGLRDFGGVGSPARPARRGADAPCAAGSVQPEAPIQRGRTNHGIVGCPAAPGPPNDPTV